MTRTHGASGDVLVVDDSEVAFRLARLAAERLGFRVDHAWDGAQALRMMQTRRYAAILLDLYMPVLDGLSFLRIQEAQPPEGRVPVVVISAAGGDEDVRRALSLGAAAFVHKPFTHEAICGALLRAVDGG